MHVRRSFAGKEKIVRGVRVLLYLYGIDNRQHIKLVLGASAGLKDEVTRYAGHPVRQCAYREMHCPIR